MSSGIYAPTMKGAKCIYDAYELALDLAPEAILKETGYEISSLLSALIPGLLQMVVVVGATTFLGAAIGGIVGFFLWRRRRHTRCGLSGENSALTSASPSSHG